MEENPNQKDKDELCMKLCKTIADGMVDTGNLLGGHDTLIDIDGFSKKQIKDIANKCTKKLKYNPDKMWFDYQNLFEKARNKVLGISDNIIVKHEDFEKNFIARHALFYSDNIDKNLLKKLLDGDLESIRKLKQNLWIYSDTGEYNPYCGDWEKKEYEYNDNEYKNLARINHDYLFTILFALDKYNEWDYNYYFHGDSGGWDGANDKFVPDYFNKGNLIKKDKQFLKNLNFYAITRPIFGGMFFDKNFY